MSSLYNTGNMTVTNLTATTIATPTLKISGQLLQTL
jgi:hypothetical protein